MYLDNGQGECLLFSRLINWTKTYESPKTVTVVAEDGEQIKVAMIVLEFLCPVLLQNLQDPSCTAISLPVSGETLKHLEKILDPKLNDLQTAERKLVMEAVTCLGIPEVGFLNFLSCRNINFDETASFEDKEYSFSGNTNTVKIESEDGEILKSSNEIETVSKITLQTLSIDNLEAGELLAETQPLKTSTKKDTAEKVNKKLRNKAVSFKRGPYMKKSLRPDVLTCETCGKCYDGTSVRMRQRFNEHNRKHEMEKLDCGCDISFATFVEKKKHVSVFHMNHFACDLCYSTFQKEEKLTAHLLTHEQTFVCPLCSFETKQRFKLDKHLGKAHVPSIVVEEARVEEKEVDLKCDDCGKQWLDVHALKKHKNTVHNASPCPYCAKIVKKVKNHIFTTHTADTDLSLRCEQCGKGFFEKSRLEKHKMNVHTRSRPFKCRYPWCQVFPDGYNDVSNRNSHEKKKHGKLFKEPRDSRGK